VATDSQAYWLRCARLVAWRHGFARWLQLFLPAAATVCGLGAAALLMARGIEARLGPAYVAIGCALGVAAIGAGWFARSRMLTHQQALVLLEDEGGLHTRLSTAREGIGAWPTPAAVQDGARWDWRRLGAPVAIAAALLVAARLVPLPANASGRLPREQPIAWSQVQTWLEALQETKTVEPEALEKLAARLEELRNQSPDQWYSQGSLEAGDSLRQQTETALRSMQRDLQDAQQIAAEAGRRGESKSPDQLKQMDQQWQQALKSLGSGNLPLNQELLQQAKDFQPGASGQLTPEQLQELQRQLAQGQQVCQKCVGPCEGKQPSEEPVDGSQGKGGTADGGPGGGGEHADLSLKKKPIDLKTKEQERLENEDLSHSLPAETLGITASEHEVDKAAVKAQAGGAITSTGEGGAAVWRESLVPREREVLQRYFR
jgi:hypothetical protein